MSTTKPGTKTKTRYYCFIDRETQKRTICKATTFGQGMNYVSRGRFEGRVASHDDMIGVDPKEILDATKDGVHPDQAPLEGIE